MLRINKTAMPYESCPTGLHTGTNIFFIILTFLHFKSRNCCFNCVKYINDSGYGDGLQYEKRSVIEPVGCLTAIINSSVRFL